MYKNYGDQNFFDRGILVEENHDNGEFDVLYCMPLDDEEGYYIFGDCIVDIMIVGSTEMQYAVSLEWMNLILMKCYMLSVVLTIMVLTIFHHSMRMISIMFQEKRYVTF